MAQSSREERLRANLRANLKRRKQQARAKADIERQGDLKEGVQSEDKAEPDQKKADQS